MDVQWILVCHGLLTLLVVVSFLCGHWPIFQGTFVERIHNFLTFGAYDYFLYSFPLSYPPLFLPLSSSICALILFFSRFDRRFVGALFGSKGTNAILSVEYFCCDRPNPILQVRKNFVHSMAITLEWTGFNWLGLKWYSFLFVLWGTEIVFSWKVLKWELVLVLWSCQIIPLCCSVAVGTHYCVRINFEEDPIG